MNYKKNQLFGRTCYAVYDVIWTLVCHSYNLNRAALVLSIHLEAGVTWYFWIHLRRKAFVFSPNGYRPNILNTRIPSSSFWEYSWFEIENLETSLGIMIDFVVILNWERIGCTAVWLPMMQLSDIGRSFVGAQDGGGLLNREGSACCCAVPICRIRHYRSKLV